jgi:hypothetical protein
LTADTRARIRVTTDGAPNYRGTIDFMTGYGTADLTPKMTISGGGNVGIGTTAPGASLQVNIPSATTIGQIIKAAASQTADLQQWQNSAGSPMCLIDKYGRFVYGVNVALTGAGISALSTDVGQVVMVIRGLASQTGDLQQWQNSAGTPLAVVSAGGNVGIGATSPNQLLQIGNTNVQRDSYLRIGTGNATSYREYEIGVPYGGASTANPYYDFVIRDVSQNAIRFLIDYFTGNVGIGTTGPSATLEVNGNIKAKMQTDLTGSAAVWGGAVAGTVYEIGYDVAELFEANEEVEPGDVLSIDEDGKLKKTDQPYDTKVAGIVSEAPAILFEGSSLEIAPQPVKFQKGKKPPLALVGRVRVKVTTENGPIKPGDLLTTSEKQGYAMLSKEHKPGTILGKALESLDKGTAKIKVLVTLQ